MNTIPDLVLTDARLRGRPERVDIAVHDGVVSAVSPTGDRAPAATTEIAADGRLVLPGLVESHLHLEKAYLLDRMEREARTLADAMSLTAAMKQGFTPADMRTRALRVLRQAVTHGVTTVRAHVEVDDTLMTTALETMLALREEVRGVVDLQVVVFPQEGITTQRHGEALMREAVRLGADAIGGIPYADPATEAHLDLVFALAVEHGLPLDFHIDLSDDPAQRDILAVIERTRAAGLQGRVTAGHLTSLGSVPAAEAADICAALAETGISVVALPMTDVYLNGRGDAEAPRRGLTPVQALRAAGANVAVSTNNIQNPFTPFGRGSLLDTALFLADLCHLGTADDAEYVVDMMTSNAAVATGLVIEGAAYAVAPGHPADLVVFDATDARGVLNDCTRPDTVVKGGRVVTPQELPR